MSSAAASPASDISPNDIWAGKSRNAKAQARHRAKRKAYIEQLEQTVSKLQTALALSTDEVTGLPSAQMKLRELKEENDSLRAELRKYQTQPLGYLSPPLQIQTPPEAGDYELHSRHTKRRRLSMDDEGPRYAYLASANESNTSPIDHTAGVDVGNSRLIALSASHSMASSRGYYPQNISGITLSESPVDAPSLRDMPVTWAQYPHPPPASHSPDSLSSGWSFSSHNRQRSSSGSSASSDASSAYLASIPSSFPHPVPSVAWRHLKPSQNHIDPSNASFVLDPTDSFAPYCPNGSFSVA
ncbi:hypothetical protein BU17DRAFT_85560 [Hysterangium stoloniferum]|nr:hypothetical protein BU17DRAFT_85560 [Hysterangium stoloniferum]